MSKKKAAGNTMTLKDFHGGSIPSDLPLPSAPGLLVRPSDRPGYDRPAQWGSQMGRAEARARPHTSPAARHFDDKTPFLTHTANIGRNFDEDERKPLDGGSAPRRALSDESGPPRADPKRESVSPGGSWGRPGSGTGPGPAPQDLYSGMRPGGEGGAGRAYPNAWAARKEAAAVGAGGGVAERAHSTWSGPDAVSKLAHASALEKVSSGRWQSKPSANYAADAELMRSSEPETGFSHSKGYGGAGDWHGDNAHGIGKDAAEYDRARAPVGEVKERSVANYREKGQPDRDSGKFGGADLETQTSSEPEERPKLKLFPRTKPLETFEPPVVEPVQANERHGSLNSAKSGSVSVESDKQVVERPKLNLKPRSQHVEHHVEQLEGSIEGERNSLFGGARPRELVLKERGVDDVTINHDTVQHAERVEHNVPPMSERTSGHANAVRYIERTENPALDTRAGKKFERREHEVRSENTAVDQRLGRKPERREQHGDAERVDGQRRNWRSGDNRRNNREMEKQPQQQPDRAPSPETWRKPLDQPKSSSVDSNGPRHGKVASAIELATAFSKSSVSDPKDRFSGQRNLPGRGQPQVPFSRLTGPTPRPQPQLNGY